VEVILKCPVCSEKCELLDVVDFNKSCEELRGFYLPLSGKAVYYALCNSCGFCFAPEFGRWGLGDFEREIYNHDYAIIDPDYLSDRPRANAQIISSMLGEKKDLIRHLDYGGGNGLLSQVLCDQGWNSHSYDPFVNREVSPNELGKFNLITAFEVFEHVPDVSRLMQDLSMLLASPGIIFFSTLLSNSHIKPNERITWWYASPRNGHISLFSNDSLCHLAEKSGFSFGSFSEGAHVFWNTVPSWAKQIVRA